MRRAKRVPVSEVTVCVLERERHQKIIFEVRRAGPAWVTDSRRR